MNAAQQQVTAQPLARYVGRLLPLVARVGLGVLLLFGMIVAVRRMAIGQATPVSLSTTLATAAAILPMVLATRLATAGQLNFWLPTVVLATWAVACSFPGSQPIAWLVWIGSLATDLLVAQRLGTPQATGKLAEAIAPTTDTRPPTTTTIQSDNIKDLVEASELLDTMQPTEDGEVVLQHVVRVRTPSGNESIHATLRGELDAGQRRTTLYVGFCPPFTSVPQVEAEVMEGPCGVAKVVQALHNGAQIEVDLDEASLEPAAVTVEVAAYEAE